MKKLLTVLTFINLPVGLKIFKSEYVQNPYSASCCIFRFINSLVNFADNMNKQPPVNTFYKCISNVNRLISR